MWCTGFRSDVSWIGTDVFDPDVFDPDGEPGQRRGAVEGRPVARSLPSRRAGGLPRPSARSAGTGVTPG